MAHHCGRLAPQPGPAPPVRRLPGGDEQRLLPGDRPLPLSLVATIEFVATIAVALFGLRSARNYAALALAAGGVFVLTDVRWASDALGLAYTVANGLLFIAYIVLGHRIAGDGAGEGVGRLGAAMAIAFAVVMPIGFRGECA